MNYRCYHINNFYLSGIHAGIQSAHAQHELAMKYLVDPAYAESVHHAPAKAGYLEWAQNHKTIIVLNGGMQSNLEEWAAFLTAGLHPFAWAKFNEAEEALNGALTNIALVLPERIYAYSRSVPRAYEAMDTKRPLTVQRVDDGEECRLETAGNGVRLVAPDGDELVFSYYELELMTKLGQCGLM